MANPCPYVPMASFLPSWAKVSETGTSVADCADKDGRQVSLACACAYPPPLLALTWCFHKKLDMVRFMAACDCFAIAYEAAGALKYASAMAHKRNLLQIACRAGLEKRRHYLCQFYDEVSRSTLCES